MPDVTTFIIADNQDITYAGIASYIAKNTPDSPTRRAVDKKGLISALMACGGDSIVILDYTLFDIHSVDDLLVLIKRFDHSHWILFSHELSESLIRRLTAEPSVSLLLKDCSEEEIVASLKCALRRKRFLCHQVTTLLLSGSTNPKETPRLTATETDILRLVALGKSVKEIATMRCSSIHTITTHKKNIFRKLEVNTVYEATRYALRAGIIEMMEYYI